MNILRNLEAVVIAALALTFVTAVATAGTNAPATAAPAAAAVDANMVIITDVGQRLSAEEKLKLAD